MRQRRAIVGVGVLALAGFLAVVLWPRGVTEDDLRDQRLMFASRTIQVGMTPGEVEQVLLCPPDEVTGDGSLARWTTRGHFGHTVTVEYENGRVKHVEGRTWRSKPDPSLWDDLRCRLGL
jgi:hypothetical protein